jgi:hypothetical protein
MAPADPLSTTSPREKSQAPAGDAPSSLAALSDARSAPPASASERFREAARLLEIEGAARAPEASRDSPAPSGGIDYSVRPGAQDGRDPDIEVRFSMRLREQTGVRFELDAGGAASVQIAGEFNDWRPEPMQPDPSSRGCWLFIKPLPRGEHRYKFVVNGEWINDPLNPMRKPNPFGGTDSIVCINPGPFTAD